MIQINKDDVFTDGKCNYRVLSVSHDTVEYETDSGYKHRVSRRTFDELLEPTQKTPFRLKKIGGY